MAEVMMQKAETEKLGFKCPRCGGEVLEEVCKDVTTFQKINAVYYRKGEGAAIDWEPTDYEDQEGGHIDRFQCVSCEYALEDKNGFLIRKHVDLAKWLKNPVDYLKTV